jgi:hypothetical protein
VAQPQVDAVEANVDIFSGRAAACLDSDDCGSTDEMPAITRPAQVHAKSEKSSSLRDEE